MADDINIPIHLYDRLDKVLEVATRCAALIEAQGGDIKEIKDEAEKRWRDHESRIRLLEVSTMKSEDILKLTGDNATRISSLETSAKEEISRKQGMSKVTALIWGGVVVVIAQIGNIFSFLEKHLH